MKKIIKAQRIRLNDHSMRVAAHTSDEVNNKRLDITKLRRVERVKGGEEVRERGLEQKKGGIKALKVVEGRGLLGHDDSGHLEVVSIPCKVRPS